MKFIKLLVFVFVAAALSQNAFSQRKLSGKVLEVLDGKTAVVQIGMNGKLTVVLQYIEIPEADQPLNDVVKKHLTDLLLGKTVQILPRGMVESKTVAQVFIDNVDVSQQMIRDGAAWFAVPERTEKSGAEVEVYISNEALAKAEKRGVWSVEGMKPAWEFRTEKIQREKAQEVARIEAITKQNREKYQKPGTKKLPPPPAIFSNYEMWKDGRTGGMWDEMQFYMVDQPFNENGLMIFRNDSNGKMNKASTANISFVVTKDAVLDLANGKSNPKIACAIAYVTGKSTKEKAEQVEVFVMGCRSQSEKQNFKPTSQLTFTAGGKKINFGKVVHLGRQNDKRFDEMMIYFLDRNAVTKIAAAEKVQIKMGDFSGAMPSNFHSMVKHLVIESGKENVPQTAKATK